MQVRRQGALADLEEALRIEPASVFAMASRADVKRMLGDLKVGCAAA